MMKFFRAGVIYSNLALLGAACIWGVSFVAQKAGMEYVGPFTFNAARTFLGGLSLLPVIAVFKLLSLKNDTRTPEEKFEQHKTLAAGGMLCGLLLFGALSINQYCMIYAPAGKAGFITSLYIIFVPLIAVFMKKKLRINVKISVLLAVTGLYLLCFKNTGHVEFTDVLLLLSAFVFGLHIITVNYYSHRVSSAKLSCVQFFTACILSLPLMFMFENPQIADIMRGAKPVLFSGVIATGVAYTLQILGQKGTTPVVASLFMSLESVFAMLGGIVLLGEVFTIREAAGCVFMICAILLSQIRLPFLNPRKSDRKY